MYLSTACKIFNVKSDDLKWFDGFKYPSKNRYCVFGDYLLVELTQERFMICDNNEETKKLLRKNCFCDNMFAKCHHGYFHKMYKETESHSQALMHKNYNRFDNRYENLESVTCYNDGSYMDNMRYHECLENFKMYTIEYKLSTLERWKSHNRICNPKGKCICK